MKKELIKSYNLSKLQKDFAICYEASKSIEKKFNETYNKNFNFFELSFIHKTSYIDKIIKENNFESNRFYSCISDYIIELKQIQILLESLNLNKMLKVDYLNSFIDKYKFLENLYLNKKSIEIFEKI